MLISLLFKTPDVFDQIDWEQLFNQSGEEFGFETQEELQEFVKDKLKEYIEYGECIKVEFEVTKTDVFAKVK